MLSGMNANMAPSKNPTAGSSKHPCLMAVLRMAGLRPTRQRIALARLLFAGGPRHASAEQLHAEAEKAGVSVSLATVYNTLHQFRGAGLLREISVDGSRTYFDTDTSNHHHFFIEGEERVIDINSDSISVVGLPEAPRGMEVSHVDIVVRVRRRDRSRKTRSVQQASKAQAGS